MTPTKRPTEITVLQRQWQGLLIRLGVSAGLLALALILASRFS